MKSIAIIAIVLAAAIAAPASAAPNNNGFQQSSEGNKFGGLCTFYAEEYSASQRQMNAARTKQERAAARERANWFIGKGHESGCAWIDGV
jgi:hypothetical protein